MIEYIERTKKPFISKLSLVKNRLKSDNNLLTDSESKSASNKTISNKISKIKVVSNRSLSQDSNSDTDFSSSSSSTTTEMYGNYNDDNLGSSSSSSEAEPNFNVSQRLRRSLRTPKPINRLNLFTIVCISCLFMITCVDSLALTDSVIWNKVKNPIVSGIKIVTTVINYKNPCELFTELMINEKSTNELKAWRETQFDSHFIKPLGEFCTNVGPKDFAKFGLIREKRLIFVGAIALFTIIAKKFNNHL
jgi:hypothetical protein